MRLLLARHGESQANGDGLLTGQIDSPLSALGKRQAEALALRLATWRFDSIIASDLVRARATAEAVARYHTLSVEIDPDLREIDCGAWSGKALFEWTGDERAHFEAVYYDPMGRLSLPDGESFIELADRVERAKRRALERFPSGTVLWVAHGGVISALVCRALGVSFDKRRLIGRENCALFEFTYFNELTVIKRLNDTAHLETLEPLDA
jgi:broad specificity phosphatase PhoE